MSVHCLSSAVRPRNTGRQWQRSEGKDKTSVFLQFQSRTDDQGESSCVIHKWNLFLARCTLRLFFTGSPIHCLLLLRHHHVPGSNPLIDCTRSTLIGIQREQSLLPAGRAFTLMNLLVKGRGAVGEEVRFSLLFCLALVFYEMRQSGTSGQELHMTMKTANQGIPRFILSRKAEASICTGHRSIFSSELRMLNPGNLSAHVSG